MRNSFYKTPEDLDWLRSWQKKVLQNSKLEFTTSMVPTSFGNTCVHTHNAHKTELPAVLILPGMLTSSLYWVINNSLVSFKDKYRLFLIDNVGQPGLSEGTNPNVKTNEYGKWLNELTDFLQVKHAFWVGASFGCQLIVKLSQVAPEKISKAVFICPGGIIQIGMTWKNLSSNMGLIWFKNKKVSERFIRNVVYGKTFRLEGNEHALLLEAIHGNVSRFKMNTCYPYPMKKEEFANMKMPLLIMPGEDDPMFSPKRLSKRIPEVFPVQPEMEVLMGHGHGSELSPLALEKAEIFFNHP
jgi:pimeloyl-ACP methyl ester carboxylesterase